MEQDELDSDDWLQLVARLGGEAALAASAREHGAFLRARRLKSAVDLLRMALMYGPGGQSLRSLAAMAAAQGVADLSDVSLMERLRNAAGWLEALCAENLSRVARTIGVKDGNRPIRIVDGSRIEGPGNRAWRLHLCYAPHLARITDAAITTLKEGERLDRLAVTPGEIRLGDRGYPHPDAIKDTLEAGADVLLRLTWNSLQLRHADGQPLDWMRLFEQANAQGALDLAVRVHKAHSREKPCEMRLVLIKKPPDAAARARTKARRTRSKFQRQRTDPRTLAAADHLILLTSLGAQDFPVDAIGALYRLRLQIEIAIKRLKSILRIDRLPAKDPDLARAWLYAHLLLALILDETLADPGAIPPSTGNLSPDVPLAHDNSARKRPARRDLAAA
ncbi:transposase [Dongia sp.]|uniref:transposase n=1 Tax=Dongia sp. TaxID=1977262 RepID=UPI0037539995